MASFMKEFEHLEIQLEDIKLATNNFDDNKVIGNGGFGKVYKGEISHSKGRSMVAFKRLDRIHGQGDPEFWKEIMMLSRYTHQNLISLLGFCNESGEKILVYEHASNGSLDRHLSSTALTWTQRIKICLDAARGLSYLHDHKGTQQRVLHRDIKSSNILLDENWNAKVSDMGLSKIGPANQHYTSIFTNVVGTPGYCDPLYMETYSLTKESDVYSFGVVLFEVLCGRLCYIYCNGQLTILVHAWKKRYKEKKLNELIFKDLMQEMRPRSLETFSDTAFQCLQKSREQRPTMPLVVEKLVAALEFQEHLLMDVVTPLVYFDKVNEEIDTDPLNWKLFCGDNTELDDEGIDTQQLSSMEQLLGMLDLSSKPSSSSDDVVKTDIQVEIEKMEDRIIALHELVAPFGKMDTASVLYEAIGYIKFLHGQVDVLSNPSMKNGASTLQQQQTVDKPSEGPIKDLRSRGLCLVPVSSTFPVTHETPVDF